MDSKEVKNRLFFPSSPRPHAQTSIFKVQRWRRWREVKRNSSFFFLSGALQKEKKKKTGKERKRKGKPPENSQNKAKLNSFKKIVAQNNKTHSQATCWHCVPE